MLRDLLRVCPIENSIIGIIDNNPRKWGTFLSVREREIPVMSLEQALAKKVLGKRILLTVSYLAGIDIMEQLSDCALLKDVSMHWILFLTEEIRNASYHPLPSTFRFTCDPIIPKTIHYCWFGGKQIPSKQKKYIDGWKQMCPEFEIVCWDESNYDIRKNQYVYQAYQAGAWAFVSDYVRKDVLYEYGGIYLDTDVEVVRPLDELLYQQGFCGFDDNKINSGLGIGAMRGLPIIGEMRDEYNNHEFVLQNRKKMKIGPDYETDLLVRHGLKVDESYQKVAGMTVYPPEVLSSAMIFSDEYLIKKHTYTVHHFAGSWVDADTRAKWDKMRCLYRMVKENSLIAL